MPQTEAPDRATPGTERHLRHATLSSLLLLLGSGLSAAWVLSSNRWSSVWHGFPNTASTTLLMFVAVAASKSSVPHSLKWSVVAGLGCSALGDAFLMARRDFFLPGLVSFLAAHVCYLWAFTRDARLAGCKWPFPVWGACGIALMVWLLPSVPGVMRVPVVLYAVALTGMAAQAACRAACRRELAAVLAAIGAGLFVVSDSVLAFQRFEHPLPWGRMVVLATYFAAQAGIALSVIAGRHREVTSLPG